MTTSYSFAWLRHTRRSASFAIGRFHKALFSFSFHSRATSVTPFLHTSFVVLLDIFIFFFATTSSCLVGRHVENTFLLSGCCSDMNGITRPEFQISTKLGMSGFTDGCFARRLSHLPASGDCSLINVAS